MKMTISDKWKFVFYLMYHAMRRVIEIRYFSYTVHCPRSQLMLKVKDLPPKSILFIANCVS